VSPPQRPLQASLSNKSGTEIEPQDLADLLVDAGFTREDPVEEHGSFTIRGGIVDVFAAGDAEPVRIEFVGDMVETLRRFDPATQRSTAPVDQLAITPLRERFEGPAEAGHSVRHDEEPADARSVRLQPDLVSVLDFFSAMRGLKVIVSELEQVAETAAKVRDQLEVSHGDAAARGHVVSLPPAMAFVSWEDIEARAGSAPRLEELAIESEGVRQVSCQPAMEFRGRVTDWIADVRQARQRGDTVLFVADSHGRAERTVEILQEYEIVAVPVERAEDAHAASVLVAVGALSRGFRLADAAPLDSARGAPSDSRGALQIYAETDVFEEERRAPDKRRNLATSPICAT
jgi:transcription-repair coupling factor (superfamily II helicase)